MRLEEDVATANIPATFGREGLTLPRVVVTRALGPINTHCPTVRTQVYMQLHAVTGDSQSYLPMNCFASKTAYAAWLLRRNSTAGIQAHASFGNQGAPTQ